MNMELNAAYRVMQANCGIKYGDAVRILRTWKRGEMGSECVMYDPLYMAKLVGRVGFASIYSDHITLTGPDGLYVHVPFFCLELVEKAKVETKSEISSEISFAKDGLTAGGIFISRDTIKRNLNF